MKIPTEFIIAESHILQVLSELETEQNQTLDYQAKAIKNRQVERVANFIEVVRTFTTALRLETINTKAKILAVEQWQKWVLSEKNIIEPEIMKAYYDQREENGN
jgi:hypothetical protein